MVSLAGGGSLPVHHLHWPQELGIYQDRQSWFPLVYVPCATSRTHIRVHLVRIMFCWKTYLKHWQRDWGCTGSEEPYSMPSGKEICVLSPMGQTNHMGSHLHGYGTPWRSQNTPTTARQILVATDATGHSLIHLIMLSLCQSKGTTHTDCGKAPPSTYTANTMVAPSHRLHNWHSPGTKQLSWWSWTGFPSAYAWFLYQYSNLAF